MGLFARLFGGLSDNQNREVQRFRDDMRFIASEKKEAHAEFEPYLLDLSIRDNTEQAGGAMLIYMARLRCLQSKLESLDLPNWFPRNLVKTHVGWVSCVELEHRALEATWRELRDLDLPLPLYDAEGRGIPQTGPLVEVDDTNSWLEIIYSVIRTLHEKTQTSI